MIEENINYSMAMEWQFVLCGAVEAAAKWLGAVGRT